MLPFLGMMLPADKSTKVISCTCSYHILRPDVAKQSYSLTGIVLCVFFWLYLKFIYWRLLCCIQFGILMKAGTMRLYMLSVPTRALCKILDEALTSKLAVVDCDSNQMS